MRRAMLARAAVPRLLLVADGAEPPELVGIDEDWIRLPATDQDIATRATQMLRFDALLRIDEPYIDARQVLHRAGVSVPLRGTEASILALLLRRRGSVVSYPELIDEVWAGVCPSRGAIEAAIGRLRRRLSGLSMSVRSVRGRGVVVDFDRAH